MRTWKLSLLLILLLTTALGSRAQLAVSPKLFGVSPNKNSTVQCYSDGNNIAAAVKRSREWDNGSKLPQIFNNGGLGSPTWTAIDSLINNRALGTNVRTGINVSVGGACPGAVQDIIYTFGATPEWASACQGQGDPSPCLTGPAGTTVISSTCSITSGAAVLTCPGASPGFTSFTTTEGPAITVTGAGAAGGTLTTYILTFTSATQVTLAANASTTVTGTSTATLSGYGGNATCSGPQPNPDFGCTPIKDVNTDGSGTDATWMGMVAAVIGRYVGKVTHWEWWNEFDSGNFWCSFGGTTACGGGNPQTTSNVPSNNRLVRMAWDAYNIMKCLDPAAKALSPSMHVGTALTTFHYWNVDAVAVPQLTAGVNGYPGGCPTIAAQTVTGKQTYDYANIHPRGTTAAYPTATGNWNPAALLVAATNLQTEIANDSLPNPTVFYGDETGYNSLVEAGGNSTGQCAFVAQEYILAASVGFAGIDWYQWDTTSLSLQGTLPGTCFDTTAGWLTPGGIISPCVLAASIYTCPLTKGGITYLLAWDTSKYSTTCCLAAGNQIFGAQYTSYTSLTGSVLPTTGGNGTALTGWSPILLTATPTPPGFPTQIDGATKINGSTVVN